MRRIIYAVILVAIIVSVIGCSSKTEENPTLYLTLVNKTHRLPNNWESGIRLDTANNSLNETFLIEHKTYANYLKLQEALSKKGIRIELDSVYRSVEEQQAIWDAWASDPKLGEEYCEKYLATPGFSEHHTGLGVDIFIMKGDIEIRDNDDMIADTEDFAVIHELMPEYGFILRYPKGKEDITGYAYEPWHLRYVGSADVATTITEQGLTLEEYLGAN